MPRDDFNLQISLTFWALCIVPIFAGITYTGAHFLSL